MVIMNFFFPVVRVQDSFTFGIPRVGQTQIKNDQQDEETKSSIKQSWHSRC